MFDDVVSVELRAIAGATYPLVDPSYTPDAAASAITDGLTDADTTYLSSFPYLGTPQSGYTHLELATASWPLAALATAPVAGDRCAACTHHTIATTIDGTSSDARARPRATRRRSESVALDIGGGLGALVIYPGERFRDHEIEISRVDEDGAPSSHGRARARLGLGSTLTAIFGSLPAGEYVIWEDSSTAGPVIEVPDGGVAQILLD